MKTVSAAFSEQQKQASTTVVRQVYYKRRYWKPSTRSYDWESSWTELTEDKVQSVSSIIWSLDNDQLNEFKVSNVTLVVDNSDNKWSPTNPAGYFGRDSNSNLVPYEPFWMKFQIKSGFVLADGTTETVSIFTGVAVDYNFDSEKKTTQITVQGLEALLLGTKAEVITTTVTEENAGTGNASTTVFTTLNPGVSIITEVSSSGAKKVEGVDYTVSNLNSATLGASVTFTVAPDVGKVIRISYLYWPQNNSFDAIVRSLLTASGISSQHVDNVVFANSVLNSNSYTTKADFDTGTLLNVSTSRLDGSVEIDFSNDNFKQSTTYGDSLTGWTNDGGWTHDGTYLKDATLSSSFLWRSLAVSSQVGSWEFKVTRVSGGGSASLNFWISARDRDGTFAIYDTAVNLTINSPASGATTYSLIRYTGSALTQANLGTYSRVESGSEVTVKISRFGDGSVQLFIDGSLVVNSIPNVDGGGALFVTGGSIIAFQDAGTSASYFKVRGISIPTALITGSWTSPVIDAGSTPTAWGVIDRDETNAGTTITYATSTSADNITYDAFVDASAGLTPQSTLRRYFKGKFSFSFSSALIADPSVQTFVLKYTTSSVLITLPNFSGISVYEALQRLGEFTNYEFGFSPDESFFFRSKNVGTSVLSLDQSNYISSITSLDLGHSRVYGLVRVTYGSITKELTDDGNASDSGAARFKTTRYELNPDSDIIVPATADIATGVAQSLFSYLSKPKRRAKVVTHFLPQLDLSDVVTMTLVNNWPDQVWYLGDDNPAIYIGNMGLDLWGDDGQFMSALQVKIISARYDTNQRVCEFEVEEII